MTLQEFIEALKMEGDANPKLYFPERLVIKLLGTFYDDQNFTKMEAAILEKNYAEVHPPAHALKGMPAYICGPRFHEIVTKISDDTKVGNYENLETDFPECKAAYEELMGNLKKLLGKE